MSDRFTAFENGDIYSLHSKKVLKFQKSKKSWRMMTVISYHWKK